MLLNEHCQLNDCKSSEYNSNTLKFIVVVFVMYHTNPNQIQVYVVCTFAKRGILLCSGDTKKIPGLKPYTIKIKYIHYPKKGGKLMLPRKNKHA